MEEINKDFNQAYASESCDIATFPVWKTIKGTSNPFLFQSLWAL